METNEQRSALTEGLALSYTCEWDYVWARLMLERGMTYESRFGWRTSAKDIDQLRGLVTVLFEFEMENGPTHAIVGIGAMFALVSLNPNWGTVGVHVAARHHGREEVEQVRSELLVAFPRRTPSTAIPIRFWMVDGDNRVQTRTRYLECPEWDAVAANYPKETRGRLDRLMGYTTQPEGGQLILWHGLPGTGKTWALQALARSWSPWCGIEYVIDPERFLGSAHYLVEALIDRVPMEAEATTRRRLFVLEDTGELLTADAKSRVGNALMRFLNVVDGFIGRGLPVMILVTANEELGSLHPAVARPGRCADIVEFKRLSAHEATEWLAARGVANGQTSSSTLADLFAEVNREGRTPTKPSIGSRWVDSR